MRKRVRQQKACRQSSKAKNSPKQGSSTQLLDYYRDWVSIIILWITWRATGVLHGIEVDKAIVVINVLQPNQELIVLGVP